MLAKPLHFLLVTLLAPASQLRAVHGAFQLLDPEDFKPLFHDVKINATAPADQGPLNEPAFEWAKANVPFFECSDKDIETAYAFRWRAYFTHIIPTNETTNPWVISECYSPTIPGRCSWAAPSGAINAAAGHHIRGECCTPRHLRWRPSLCPHTAFLMFLNSRRHAACCLCDRGALDQRPDLHGL